MILLVLVLAASLATTPMDVDRPALADCGEVAGMAEVIEDADPSTEAIHGTVIAAESRGSAAIVAARPARPPHAPATPPPVPPPER